MVDSLGNVIATREYFLLDEPGKKVKVFIGMPEEHKSKRGDIEFWCSFQIIGLSKEETRTIIGIDAIQSLQLAIRTLGAALYATQEARDGKLRWLDAEDKDLGFPAPSK